MSDSTPLRALVIAGALALFSAAFVQAASAATPAPDQVDSVRFEPSATGAEQPLDGKLELRFAGRELSRTVVRCMLAIGSSFARRNQHGYYNLRLSGEVLHDQGTVDRFAYRFDIPTGSGGETTTAPLALEFARDLRPGRYRLSLELEDLFTGQSFAAEHELEVPSVSPGDGSASGVRLAPGIDFASGATAPGAAPADPQSLPVRLALPDSQVLVGLQRVGARVRTGAAVAAVRFLLDGRPVLTKSLAPFDVELDFGHDSAVHAVAVEALDAGGAVLGRDQKLLDTGSERFDVAWEEPRPGAHVDGEIAARPRFELPRGARLARVDYYIGDRLVTTVSEPSFDREVKLPPVAGTAALRVVALLDDGRSAESTTLVNATDVVDRVDVRMVQLYAAVVNRRGRPIDGLKTMDFAVRENGTPQQLARVERVTGLPLHLALVVDVSRSMTAQIASVSDAATGLLRGVMRSGDRAELVTFDTFPRLAVDFTGDLDRLANGLVGLRADGSTALYDGVGMALRDLEGIAGQRMLVLFSDGDATRPRNPEGLIELARCSGVTIYTVGLAIDPYDVHARQLLTRLAGETGGRSFFIDSPHELARAYHAIQAQMRSRYLIAYQSSSQHGSAFRQVDVAVDRPGVEVRTIRGYYP